eukprot:tig00001024_g6339.t1
MPREVGRSPGRPSSAASTSVFERLSTARPGSPALQLSVDDRDRDGRWLCGREAYLTMRPARMSEADLAESRRAAWFDEALAKRLVAQKKAREAAEEEARWKARARAEADEMIREAKERTRALLERAEEQARAAAEEAEEREREEERLALLAASRGKFGPLADSVATVAGTPVRRARYGAARFMVLPVSGVAYLEEHARRITHAPSAKAMQKAASESAILARSPPPKDPKAFLRLYPPRAQSPEGASDGGSDGAGAGAASPASHVRVSAEPGRAEWEPHACSNCRAKSLFQARVVPASPRPPASWYRKQARQRQRFYAAVMIQCAGRRFLAGRLLRWRRQCFLAAVPINACVRRFLVGRHRPTLVSRLNAMHLAAVAIQVRWRHWAARRRAAAQKLWRAWRAQRLWLLAQRAGELRRASVLRIQKLWRGVRVRMAFANNHRRLARAAARIQAVVRMARRRRALNWYTGNRQQAAGVIQRFWRRLRYRRWLRSHQRERAAGATVVQRAWRWHAFLRRAEERGRARERRLLALVRRCALRWRQAAAFTRWARHAKDAVILDRHQRRRINAAATALQAAWRARQARLDLRRGRAARLIQAAVRGALSRREHRRRVAAGRTLLGALRRYLRYKRWPARPAPPRPASAPGRLMRELRRVVDMPDFWRPGAAGVADRRLVVDEWTKHKGRVRALYFRYLLSGALRFHLKARQGQFALSKAQWLTMMRDMGVPLGEAALVNVFIAANRETAPPPGPAATGARRASLTPAPGPGPAFSVAPPDISPPSPGHSPPPPPSPLRLRRRPPGRPAPPRRGRARVAPGKPPRCSYPSTPRPRPALADDGAGAGGDAGAGGGVGDAARRAEEEEGEEGAARMTASEMIDGFMRVASLLYDDDAAAAAGRVRRFVEAHVAAVGDTALAELHASSVPLLDSPAVRNELAPLAPVLQRLFRRIPAKSPVQPEGPALASVSITLADFVLLFKFAGLIGSGGALSYAMAVRAFLRVNRAELEAYLTSDPAGDGFVDRMQMQYPEFEEGVCQCAALWALGGDKAVPMGVAGANQAAYAASGGLLVAPLPPGSLARFVRRLQDFYGL